MRAGGGQAAEHFQCHVTADPDAAIARLIHKGFVGIGRVDRAPVPFVLPFDWHGIDIDDQNWMFQLQAWRMLDPYLQAVFTKDGNPVYFDHCLDVISDWARDNIPTRDGTFTWYDMSTGIRASKLALLAHAAPVFGRDLFAIPGFETLLLEHFSHLMNRDELNEGNHGLFQMQGLKSLATAFPGHVLADNAATYARHIMTKLICLQMGPDAVHTESSPGYHFFACNRIGLILQSPDWQEGGVTLLDDPGKYAYQKDRFRRYFRSRRAHNTITFNDPPDAMAERPVYGTGIKSLDLRSPGLWELRGEVPLNRKGDRHQRRVLLQSGRRMVVFDRVVPTGPEENTYTLWWHFPPSARVTPDDSTCSATISVAARHLVLRHASTAGPLQTHCVTGAKAPELQGWSSPRYMATEPAPAMGLTAQKQGVFHAVTIFDMEYAASEPSMDADIPAQLAPEEHSLVLQPGRPA